MSRDALTLDALRDYLRPNRPRPPGDAATTSTVVFPMPAPPTGEAMLRSLGEADPLLPRPQLLGIEAVSRRSVAPIGAVRIIEDRNMVEVVEVVEDWSKVRSPSRAARRRRQGHRQRIQFVGRPLPDIYQFGDMLVMHPATALTFRARIAAAGDAIERQFVRQVMSTLLQGAP